MRVDVDGANAGARVINRVAAQQIVAADLTAQQVDKRRFLIAGRDFTGDEKLVSAQTPNDILIAHHRGQSLAYLH